MRRRSVVATAALIAALALAGLPVPAGSRTPSATRELVPAAFTSIVIPANAPALDATGVSDAAPVSAGSLAQDSAFIEPGDAPDGPRSRPRVDQPATSARGTWKDPKYRITGIATFYDNGTTAMRLPRGTVVRICGDGGCILRTVNDYGPVSQDRVIDMYRPDFFRVCGCASWSGTTRVTVSVY
jgi:hypothetical protein